MKKVQLLAIAAVLFAGAANAQTFRAVECQDCAVDAPVIKPARTEGASDNQGAATIDNCSVVVQGQAKGENVKDRGNNNTAVVDQLGRNNSAELYQREGNNNYGKQVQNGNGNSASAVIWGSNNTTHQEQLGDRNRAGINVDQVDGSYDPGSSENGNNNLAQQRQDGNNNDADIKTYGNRNIASQDQDGNRNSASIFQRVNRSSAIQYQDGNRNIAQTFQGGMDNVPSTVIGQHSCIEQGGNNNSALVTQNN